MKKFLVYSLICFVVISRCYGRKTHTGNSVFDKSERYSKNSKYKLENRHFFKLNVYEPEKSSAEQGANENVIHPTVHSDLSDSKSLSMEIGHHKVNVKSVLDSKKLTSAPKGGGYTIVVNPKFRHVIEIINKGIKRRKVFKDKGIESFQGENSDLKTSDINFNEVDEKDEALRPQEFVDLNKHLDSDDSTETDFLHPEEFMKTADIAHPNLVTEETIDDLFVGSNLGDSEGFSLTRVALNPDEAETEDISNQNQFETDYDDTDYEQFAVTDGNATDHEQFAVTEGDATDHEQFAVTEGDATDHEQFAVTEGDATDHEQFAVTEGDATDHEQFAVTEGDATDHEQFAVTEGDATDHQQFAVTDDDSVDKEQSEKANGTDPNNEQEGRNFESSVFNSEFEGSGEEFSEIENSEIEDDSKSGRLLGIFSRQNDTAPVCTTPKGEPGHCRRMRQCLVSDALENFNNFLQHLCLIRGALVGMCCPDNPVVEITNSEENETLPMADEIKQPPEGCGLNHKTRIVGGSIAGPQEWTWMVALMRRNRFYCGGVIINNLYILTAAHCVMGIDVKDLTVRLGEYDFSSQSRHTEDISVAEIKRHAQFVTLTFQHDIALLKLRRTITYSKFVGSICLPSSKARDYSDVNGTVVGWGTVSFGGQASPILRQVTVPVWRNKDCDRTYLLENINDSFMCAGSPERGEDACQGDSGGPLMAINERGRWEVIGIVSWGRRCGDPTFPGVYTRVTTYLDWINQNIN